MRKIPALLAVLGLTAVALVGCSAAGNGGSAACPRPAASDPKTTDLITVSGSLGALPTVSVPTPFHVSTSAFADLQTGSGTPITTDPQLVVLDIALYDGETGAPLVKTAYDGKDTSAFPLSQWVRTFPAFEAALHCATPGTRTVVALAPDGMDAQSVAQLGVSAGGSAVAVVDVRKTYLPKADGPDQYNDALGLPTVVRAPDGRPGIIVPVAAAPSDVVVQTIKKGTGDAVTGDLPVRIAYTGVTWDAKKVFHTTWDSSPESVTLSSVAPAGIAQALKGATVGSQLLVVIPASQNTGGASLGSAPAGTTVAYVIDVLGLDAAP